MDVHTVVNLTAWTSLAGLAWARVRRDREHRAFALYASWMLLEFFLRRGLRLAREGPPEELGAVGLASYHADQAIVLSWTVFFVAACVHYFVRRPIWPVLLVGVLAWLPAISPPPLLGSAFMAYSSHVFGAGVVLSWAAIIWCVAFRARVFEPKLAHLALMMFAITDVIALLAPLVELDFANWEALMLSTTLTVVAATGAHVVWIVRPPRRPVLG